MDGAEGLVRYLEINGHRIAFRPVFRRTARSVAARIPGAALVTLARAAHIVNTDDPDGFAAPVTATSRPQLN